MALALWLALAAPTRAQVAEYAILDFDGDGGGGCKADFAKYFFDYSPSVIFLRELREPGTQEEVLAGSPRPCDLLVTGDASAQGGAEQIQIWAWDVATGRQVATASRQMAVADFFDPEARGQVLQQMTRDLLADGAIERWAEDYYLNIPIPEAYPGDLLSSRISQLMSTEKVSQEINDAFLTTQDPGLFQKCREVLMMIQNYENAKKKISEEFMASLQDPGTWETDYVSQAQRLLDDLAKYQNRVEEGLATIETLYAALSRRDKTNEMDLLVANTTKNKMTFAHNYLVVWDNVELLCIEAKHNELDKLATEFREKSLGMDAYVSERGRVIGDLAGLHRQRALIYERFITVYSSLSPLGPDFKNQYDNLSQRQVIIKSNQIIQDLTEEQ